ncbi:MAG TPA: hypothetical protein VIG24_03890, partial [Acidimicrobiia bacterium]
MSADEFLKVQRDIEDAQVPRRSHPKGWEPGVDTAKGTLTVQAGDTPPSDWSAIIRELGLDPDVWTVDESQPVQVRTWDSGDRRMYYYRATVIPSAAATDVPDIETLIREVKKRKPGKPPTDPLEERALVVALADWQVGKSDHGGVEALIERLLALKDAVPARVRALAKAGKPISHLYVVGMGDMVEGCDGHYAMQTSSVELDRRQQEKMVRRILVEMLTAWAKLPVTIVVGCVPGNHGENRKNGKAYTTFEDNSDLAVFEQAAEVLTAAGFDGISWVIPDGDMTITLNICGTVCSFAHGHQFRGSGIPLAKAKSWWKDKMASMHATGDARGL